MFDEDWKCLGFQYKVGETYTHQGEISMCNAGFHFCKELQQCFGFYKAVTWNHIAEVEALGEVIEGRNKCVTNQIKIIREISFDEINEVLKDIADSIGIVDSRGIAYSRGIVDSTGITNSTGIAYSRGIADSTGIAYS